MIIITAKWTALILFHTWWPLEKPVCLLFSEMLLVVFVVVSLAMFVAALKGSIYVLCTMGISHQWAFHDDRPICKA